MTWRVGSKVPLNVYEDDKPMFQCHTPEDAARVVALLNTSDSQARAELLKDRERLDWLEKHGYENTAVRIGGVGGKEIPTKSLREAIDAAMQKEPKS
jgi:hypothetical protein